MSEQGPYPGSYPGQQPPPPSYPAPPQPYGYGYPYPPAPVAPGGRPGKLMTAAVLTWVGAGLGALMSLALVVVGIALPAGDLSDLDRDVREFDVSVDALRAVFAVMGVVGLVWCVTACVAAALMLKRRNWARVVLAVSASMTIVVSLMSITALFPVLFAGAAIAALVLMFNGEVNAWFRGQQYAVGYPPYPPQGYPPYGQQEQQHGPW